MFSRHVQKGVILTADGDHLPVVSGHQLDSDYNTNDNQKSISTKQLTTHDSSRSQTTIKAVISSDHQLTIVPSPSGILGPQGSQLITDLGDRSTVRGGGYHISSDNRGDSSKEGEGSVEHG